ncbi:MAG TPA: type II secretion system F family protein [Gammaproteobacteria bacterium]|nr:type II secretion system F family protein [Gammaproteobacteria bacterium]
MYRYRAVNPEGRIEEGEMDVPLESAVLERLKNQGFIPIRIDAAGERRRWPRRWAFGPLRRGPTKRDVELFTSELATLLGAGLPLDQCLETLTETADSEPLRKVIDALAASIRRGASLSDALADHPAFSAIYLNMVRAGEAVGRLDETLARLGEYLQRARELRDSIVSALIYPLILIGVAGISILLLMGFVLPQFSQMFADLGAALPLSTRIVIAIGELAQAYGWIVPSLVIVAALLGRRWLEVPSRRAALHAKLLRLPLAGELISKAEVARFTRMLGTMIGHGVPLLNALRIVKDSMGNLVLAQAVANASEKLQSGSGLAGPLAASSVFPKLAVKMIRVGEESGQLEQMLIRLACVYERETQMTVKRLLNVVEPALIIGLGAVIAGIILSVLTAVLGMNELVI